MNQDCDNAELTGDKIRRCLDQLNEDEVLQFWQLLKEYVLLLGDESKELEFEEIFRFLMSAQLETSATVFAPFHALVALSCGQFTKAARIILEEEYLK